ncbi:MULTISPECIES: NAD(P)/FAD-dependent oxidoreductase [unclassified Halanaerobium]|uniref:NAD(P)/FAD-dependent oxidoreductase n=1 Tax=unclassified Halanaerobium TaxID=2641197 RepID=UPI000DF48EE9|nr:MULTISPECIES: FAD-dependent oxidoreductase [unclassified Halanaerobium]RCW50795.1 pyridine nucleotide-disulfide oxidoreductase [Halanaerobium sp. MA284_MarDTE_T2]RCW84949.1 pyridine nucleotide-disulfide oxidoreductase [Halanaerobium sp. DL-01]
MKYVIIGSSAAGLSALETIRKYDTHSNITIVTADSARPHSRILTSYLIGDQIAEENIFLRSPDYFDEMGVEVLDRCRAEEINSDKKELILSSGEKISYDKLLIATGSSPKMPDYNGKELKGVFNLRDYGDVIKIKSYLNDVRVEHCFILGGGLVGMKATEAFYNLNKKVTIIIRSPQVLSQMLDPEAAFLVEKYLKSKGINIMTGESPAEIIGNEHVKQIKLQSGKTLTGELVLVGKGVRPNTDFVNGEVELNKYGEIIVDQKMQTGTENIFAAGDVVSAPDFLEDGNSAYAIWPDAIWQGKTAAKNMLNIESSYEGGLNLNALKIIDLLFYAVGKVQLNDEEKEKYNVYVRNEPGKGIYRKLVFSGHRLIGAITIGQTDDIGVLYLLIKKQIEIENRAKHILKHGINYAELMKEKVLLKTANFELTIV